ncbi:hypothetical protein NDU88_003532 [Pleurodeles waltl]|uniref:Uncharacterized protein n=1 Tax=Pleurodeles waltl TaxID=8319 RepID=A0AAV7VDJ9_PLEWA|nr:hypothetical protein NDU88_003532 [Pleurodeles waltl]
MVTAEKGSDRVTRNISWFKKAMFVEHSGDQEAEDQFPDWSTTERPEQDRESELPSVAEPGCLRQPNMFSLPHWRKKDQEQEQPLEVGQGDEATADASKDSDELDEQLVLSAVVDYD